MANSLTEKRWLAIAPQPLTANGGKYGQVFVASTLGYKVKQDIILKDNTGQSKKLEVKRVASLTEMWVGPKGNIKETTDITSFTTANAATIEASEQPRASIPYQEHENAVYAQEPIIAKRSILVDQLGDYYSVSNPFPVRLSDGSVNIGTVNAEIETQLSRRDGFPDVGDVHDAVRIGNQALEWDFFSLGGGLGAGRTYNENPVTDPVQAQLGNGAQVIASTTIGSETMLVVKKGEDPTFYVRIDRPDASTTFIGKTYDLDAATSDSVWQISRIIISGTEEITQWADDESSYDKIWNDRVSLFGAIPFANQLSIQFDGANDFLSVAHNAALSFDFRTEAASWNIWVKTSDTSAGKTYMEKQDGGSGPGWRLYLTGNNLTLELDSVGTFSDRIRVRTDPSNTVGDILNDGSWHMITATYDGSGDASGVTLYIDGVSEDLDIQNDGLASDTNNTVSMAIGSRTGGGDNFGAGNLDEPSIWDVELTSGQVTTLYNSGVSIDLQGQGVSPITTSLIEWWRMGDGPSDSFPNIVGVESGFTAVMTNMTEGDIEGAVPG